MHGRGRGEHMCREGSLCKVLVGAINEGEGGSYTQDPTVYSFASLGIFIPLQTDRI